MTGVDAGRHPRRTRRTGRPAGTVGRMAQHPARQGTQQRRCLAAAAALVVATLAVAACTSSTPSASTSAVGSVASGTVPTLGSNASSTSSPPVPVPAPVPAPVQAQVGSPSVIATGLAGAWGLVFLPDGSALASERDSHRIVRIAPAADPAQSAKITAVGTVPGVADNSGEGGLLGLALSPTFAADGFVFAYLTAAADNRVVRMTYSAGALSAPTPIFTGIPKAGNHDGGRIAFGPDGLLYVTAGDANQKDRAPDRTYLGGKVLRMTADGKPAPGNPDPSSVVFTIGHRNPQGLAWGPDGRLYEAEFGQKRTRRDQSAGRRAELRLAHRRGHQRPRPERSDPSAPDVAYRRRLAVGPHLRRRFALARRAQGRTALPDSGSGRWRPGLADVIAGRSVWTSAQRSDRTRRGPVGHHLEQGRTRSTDGRR
ncbi:MAG: PQQ-dependent sugar dehydrogenase [Pseudonocardiales bacterium]|nr:PQQ-dependent sugar dehydrogenase [Pseudonocardiales bacterium]